MRERFLEEGGFFFFFICVVCGGCKRLVFIYLGVFSIVLIVLLGRYIKEKEGKN